MVFVLGIWYLRKSAREFDPLAQRVVDLADRGDVQPRTGRFAREGAPIKQERLP